MHLGLRTGQKVTSFLRELFLFFGDPWYSLNDQKIEEFHSKQFHSTISNDQDPKDFLQVYLQELQLTSQSWRKMDK